MKHHVTVFIISSLLLGFGPAYMLLAVSVSDTVSISARVPEAAILAALDSGSGGTTTLTNANGTSAVFNFPKNFYTEDLTLQANSYADDFFASSNPAPSGKNVVGKTLDVTLFTTSEIEVSAISQAVMITIGYTDADISGLDESTITPYHWEGSSWQVIAGATRDAVNNKVTFSTASFSLFALFASPASATPPSGGGGAFFPRPAAPAGGIVFSGMAYPSSRVTLLKDAQIAATAIAGADANFQITLSGISAGNYTFSIYSEDNKGMRSSLSAFPVSVASGATATVSGIFIAPTITADKSEVKRGEKLVISGQSVPAGDITISVSSSKEFFFKTTADRSGAYAYNLATDSLNAGTYVIKSKAVHSGKTSPFSRTVSFVVGTKTIPQEPSAPSLIGDLNGDGRVNLVDFSIAAYWYNRTSPPSHIDVNADGKINLIDFSIMAYYWTG